MSPAELGAAVVAASGALAAAAWLARHAWRATSAVVHATEAILGTADRPGIVERQAVTDARSRANSEQLAAVVEQLTTLNGGSTLRAAVTRIESKADHAHDKAHQAIEAVRESTERGTSERRVIVEAVDALAYGLGAYAAEQAELRAHYVNQLRAAGLQLTDPTERTDPDG